MKTLWKAFFGIIFNRSEDRFRGLHQGYSILEDNRNFARFMMNISPRRLIISPRDGTRRRNQVNGEIHHVDVLPSAKLLAIGTQVFSAPPNELWDNRMRFSQFDHIEYDPTTWSDLDDVTWEDLSPSSTF